MFLDIEEVVVPSAPAQTFINICSQIIKKFNFFFKKKKNMKAEKHQI